MKFVRSAALILSVFCLPASALAQSAMPVADPASIGFSAERLTQIGTWYQTQIDAGVLPGAVVAIARNGKLAYMRAIGHKDHDRKIPMRPDGIFWIASMTKPVTSVAAMILVEEGKLVLDAPVSQYLPELANMQVATEETDPVTGETKFALAPQKRPMTVRDLLRHTSGLIYPNQFLDTKIHRLYGEKVVRTRNTTLADFVASLGKVPLAHQPGEVWEYSWGVDVLARVVEVASGQAFDQFLQGRIFGPLHMIDTGFYVPEAKLARLVDLPPGGRDALWDVTRPPRLFSGGGGLVSTAPDYLRFCQMLLNGGEFDGVRILAPETVQLMTTNSLPADTRFALDWIGPKTGASWGLGFAIRTNPDFSVVPGGLGSFTWGGFWGTYFWIDPVEKLIAVQMIQVASDDIRQLVRAFGFLTYAALRGPEQASLMPPPGPVIVEPHTLAAYVGTYDFGATVSASNKQAPGSPYVGIGVDIAMENGRLKVRASYPNGPAAGAGVAAADIITYVDDMPVGGLNVGQVQGRLRGPVGTPVRLRVIHPGQDNPVEGTAVREARGPTLAGLGMEIAIEDGVLKVRASFPNGAAAKAGVMAGDVITHVDDTPINGLSLPQVQGKLRGPVDTQVRLKIIHPGQDSPLDVTVVRKLIVGLGIEIAMQDGVLRVLASSPNGPASKVGVMAGDIITHVDDTSINGLNFIQAQDKLRGEVDTPVHLKIMHRGQCSPLDVTVIRKMVRAPGAELKVRMEAERLMIESMGPWPMLDFDIGKPITVRAISDVEFYVDGGDHTRIAFISDHSGRVTGAILNPGPHEVKGIRVE